MVLSGLRHHLPAHHHHHLPIRMAETSSKPASASPSGRAEPIPCPSHRHSPPGCTQRHTDLLQTPQHPPPPPSRGRRPFPAVPSTSFPSCTAQGAASRCTALPPNPLVEKLRHDGDLWPVGGSAMGTHARLSTTAQCPVLPEAGTCPPWHSPGAGSEPLASQSHPPPSSPSLHARR